MRLFLMGTLILVLSAFASFDESREPQPTRLAQPTLPKS